MYSRVYAHAHAQCFMLISDYLRLDKQTHSQFNVLHQGVIEATVTAEVIFTKSKREGESQPF
jgi:hypothetical protein